MTNLSFRGSDKKNFPFPNIGLKVSNFMSNSYFQTAEMDIELTNYREHGHKDEQSALWTMNHGADRTFGAHNFCSRIWSEF